MTIPVDHELNTRILDFFKENPVPLEMRDVAQEAKDKGFIAQDVADSTVMTALRNLLDGHLEGFEYTGDRRVYLPSSYNAAKAAQSNEVR